jgi:hypothetical protein
MTTQNETDEVVLRKALSRGAKLKEDLVCSAGGLLSSDKVAGVLGVSTQVLHDRANRRALISVEFEGTRGYPAFQFESESVREGIAMVLDAIGVEDAWARLNFMFLKLDELGGKMPIDVIRSGSAEAAALAARHFGEHGAA